MQSSSPDEQVINTETTQSPNSLSVKPHDQHCGEIKDTHVQENGKPFKSYDVDKIFENGETSHGNKMLVQGISGNELQHKDGESKVNGLSFVDPIVEEKMMKSEGKGLLVEPVDFHSQGNLEGVSNGRDFNYYKPLYKAARKGDWRTAEEFLRTDSEAVRAAIARNEGTMLHVAAKSGRASFVLKLVPLMDENALALPDHQGNTALHFAAVGGITVEAAKAMVEKNSNLTQIENKAGRTPLLACAAYVIKEQIDMNGMIYYLYNATGNEEPSMPFSGLNGANLLSCLIIGGLYDLAVKLVQEYPNSAAAEDEKDCTALYYLSSKASSFPSGSQLGFWEGLIYSMIPLQVDDNLLYCSGSDGNQVGFTWTNLIKPLVLIIRLFLAVPGIKQIYLKKLEHIQAMEVLKCICSNISLMSNDDIYKFFDKSEIMETGSANGVVELVIECIRTFPDQMTSVFSGGSILHIAVKHRKEKIFNLIDGMTAEKKLMAADRVESDNNILHLAAKLGPYSQLQTVSGAALLMQRDLQWFEEVGKIVRPSYKEQKNDDGLTPRELFTEEHEDLLGKGEKWMKDTAQSCMVVATLIATVMFAGIFTVPGGNVSDGNGADKGSPILLHNSAFMWFIISDALGLFSSTTSVLMFLSILTARYAEEDFLKSLPKRLIIGLGTLFVAIAAMMITFSAALYMVLQQKFQWASIPIAVIACLPVTLFALLQFPLVVKMYSSTYGPGIFYSDGKYKLD